MADVPTDDEREALLTEADALVASWDQKGSWSSDSPVGMVMRLAAALRRSVVPEPSTEDEFAPGECDGSGTCTAPGRIHGCFTPHRADQCDAPDEYGHLPVKQEGMGSDGR